MTEYERMQSGDIYNPGDEAIFRDQLNCLEKQYDFNLTRPHEQDKRAQMLGEMFAECGEGTYIEPPFHCDYGCNTRVGKNFYCNYDCVFLDCGNITIGDNVMLGPKVALYAVNHPIDPVVRGTHYDYPEPITIGSNVWIGGSAVVCPGVTIGDNTVIGAGSVVTKDIPANVVAAGNPCRVIRPITQEDTEYWNRQLALTHQLWDKPE